MGFFSKIKKLSKAYSFFSGLLAKAKNSIDGKKSLVGGYTLVLWIMLYVVPVVDPSLLVYAEYAKQIADFLSSMGISPLPWLYTSSGLTIIGGVDKARKMYRDMRLRKEENNDKGNIVRIKKEGEAG